MKPINEKIIEEFNKKDLHELCIKIDSLLENEINKIDKNENDTDNFVEFFIDIIKENIR